MDNQASQLFLKEAKDAAKQIQKKMLMELKCFMMAPSIIVSVMNAVCLLFNEKEDWATAKKLLADEKFLENLIEFKTESVPQNSWQKLRATYLNDPNFTKEKVAACSKVASQLFIWIQAIEKYAKAQNIAA